MTPIQMVDLKTQYKKIKPEIDYAIMNCLDSAEFINGTQVKEFEANFEKYLNIKNVIPCANGTDALQIALMALDLEVGDEVIIPAFTYAATAEVIALLKLKPIMVDVDENTFNIRPELIEQSITSRTKAIIPVHLYGQVCDMEPIMKIANQHNLSVIEDNAQAVGAEYTFSNSKVLKSGTIGHIGCTSFFPSKNLGCYGDGGALFTNDDVLAEKIRMIANHGQPKKYVHSIVGVNSRLDSLQAAILNVKLKYLDQYSSLRKKAAEIYDRSLIDIDAIKIPFRSKNSTHVFHQYTLQVRPQDRDLLQDHLKQFNIPTMIYYPIPLYKQEAFQKFVEKEFSLSSTEKLCDSVISLPIHTELSEESQHYIIDKVRKFFE